MKPGRNDPCPCGSGKKYKHCCLATAVADAASPAQLAWRRIRRANEGLVPRMMQFVAETYGEDAIDDAWSEFMLWQEDEDWDDNPQCGAFLPWMLHRWVPDPEETLLLDRSLYESPPTRRYIEREGKRLDPTTRRYLDACLTSPFGFHEILDSQPGHGFRTRELLTGAQCDVLEQSGSDLPRKGDVLFAMLVPCDGIVMMEAVSPVVIPPGSKLPIIDFRKQMASAVDGQLSYEMLHEWDEELRELYLEVVEPLLHPQMPQLRNTDGDELSLQQVIFDIESPQDAFDALKHLAFETADEELLEGAERVRDGSLRRVQFTWATAGNALHKGWGNTTLGTVEIDGNRLTAHVNSERRASEFKRIVGEALAGRARFRATKIESLERALQDRAAGPAKQSEADDELEEFANRPEVKAQLLQMMSRHYEAWVDEELPVLGGLTPLQAVADPDGREMVESLVTQIERDGRRMTPPLDESIPRMLRDRLGLSLQ